MSLPTKTLGVKTNRTWGNRSGHHNTELHCVQDTTKTKKKKEWSEKV